MLVGTADVDTLARGAPVLEDFKTAALTLTDVDVLQIIVEIRTGELEARLPPGLHPTLPPLLSLSAYRVAESPWGPFSLAQVRLECRSGVRPRAFLLGGAINNEPARAALAARWGYRLRPGEVDLARNYDETRLRVLLDEVLVLDAGLRDPHAIQSSDVQYVANMNLAHTPNGVRLVQIDPDIQTARAERGTPTIDAFDAEAWGDGTIEPVYPVSASLTLAQLTLPALRFVCLPDTLAFQGTERVN